MRTLLILSFLLLAKSSFSQSFLESYNNFSQENKSDKKGAPKPDFHNNEYYNESLLYKSKLNQADADKALIEVAITQKTQSLITEIKKSGSSSAASIKLSDELKSLKTDLKTAIEKTRLAKVESDSATGAYLLSTQGNRLTPLKYVFKPYSLGYAKAFNQTFYGTNDLSALQSISLMGDQNAASLSTEILSDYIGIVRFGLYGTISTNDSTVESDQLESIFNGGGQISLLNTLPILIFSDNKKIVNTSITINNRLSADAIGIGNVSTNFKLNNYIYTDFRMKIATANEIFAFDLSCNLGYLLGNNEFYSTIERRETWLSTLGLGINVQNKIQLKISGPAYSSSEKIQKQPYKISVLLSPKK